MTNVKFSRQLSAYGRNGYMYLTGLSIGQTYEQRIHIDLINTRQVSSTYLQIPKEDVPQLIQALVDSADIDDLSFITTKTNKDA